MSHAAYPVAAAGTPTSAAAVAAPHGRRLLAALVDLVAVYVVHALQPWWSLPLALAVFVAYHTFSLWFVGQTLGKALLGLRVERLGREPTFLWALGRSSLGYLGVDALGLGLLTALRDPQRRCAHDLVLGSRVVVADGTVGTVRRLQDFAERHREALERRKRVLAAIAAYVAWVLGLGHSLRRAIDALTPGSPSAHAGTPLKALLGKAAVVAAAATTAATGLLVVLPAVRSDGVAEVDAISGSWHADRLRQVQRSGWRPGDLVGVDWVVRSRQGRYVLVRDGREMQLAGRSDGTYVASWTGKGSCGVVESAVESRLHLRPTRSASGRPVALDVTLEESVVAPDPAEARAHRCPVEARTVYRGSAAQGS